MAIPSETVQVLMHRIDMLIALDFHFPDLAILTKFFKRQMGMTPTEYRKRAAR